MKTLWILRHGKAEGDHADGDKARPLTDRGVRDSHAMGTLIRGLSGGIELVVASDAVRAAQTARLAAQSAGYLGSIDFRPEIYEASMHALLIVVRALPEDTGNALLVGHNPSLQLLCAHLSGKCADACTLPTCGLARVDLPTLWADVHAETGLLAGLWTPKGL